MHDVAWRGMWICVRSKDAQKQLARTSLNCYSAHCMDVNIYVSLSAVDFFVIQDYLKERILHYRFGSASKCLNNHN